jgi:hypothetical protein
MLCLTFLGSHTHSLQYTDSSCISFSSLDLSLEHLTGAFSWSTAAPGCLTHVLNLACQKQIMFQSFPPNLVHMQSSLSQLWQFFTANCSVQKPEILNFFLSLTSVLHMSVDSGVSMFKIHTESSKYVPILQPPMLPPQSRLPPCVAWMFVVTSIWSDTFTFSTHISQHRSSVIF